VDFANSASTGAFYTIDTNLAYRIGPFLGRFTVQNLTNTEYWEPYQFLNGAIAPNTGRAFYLTLAAKF
jgi:outer membrane receptor protein involved in Fe transport